jgi:hypothetical protein
MHETSIKPVVTINISNAINANPFRHARLSPPCNSPDWLQASTSFRAILGAIELAENTNIGPGSPAWQRNRVSIVPPILI